VKERCGARSKQTGEPCKLGAGSGTDHPGIGQCRFHGGSTPSGRTYAARVAGARMAENLPIEPHEALLANLAAWNGIVRFFSDEVTALESVVETHRKEKTVTSGEGDSYVETSNEARLHIYAVERNAALVERGKAAKLCVEAKVEERALDEMERRGALWADAIAVVLDEFGLRADPRAPDVVRRAFRVLEGGQAA
jgi:hypothetical protein